MINRMFCLSVLTAITVQDTTGVEGVLPIDSGWVADQARALLEDMPVAAFKIGLLGSVEVIAAIAEVVSDYPDIPLVLDPVLASGRGDQFADEEMIEAMIAPGRLSDTLRRYVEGFRASRARQADGSTASRHSGACASNTRRYSGCTISMPRSATSLAAAASRAAALGAQKTISAP